MGYKTEFQANNVDLQAILEQVNSLPDASSGYEVVTGVVTCSSRQSTITCDKAIGKNNIVVLSAGTLNSQYLNLVSGACYADGTAFATCAVARVSNLLYEGVLTFDNSTGVVGFNSFDENSSISFDNQLEYHYIAW